MCNSAKLAAVVLSVKYKDSDHFFHLKRKIKLLPAWFQFCAQFVFGVFWIVSKGSFCFLPCLPCLPSLSHISHIQNIQKSFSHSKQYIISIVNSAERDEEGLHNLSNFNLDYDFGFP